MPKIFAIGAISDTKPPQYRIISFAYGTETQVTIGDEEQLSKFLHSMLNNSLSSYFEQLKNIAVFEAYDAKGDALMRLKAKEEQIAKEEQTIADLLKNTQYFQYLKHTRFVAPLGKTLADAVADQSMKSLPLASETGEVLEAGEVCPSFEKVLLSLI